MKQNNEKGGVFLFIIFYILALFAFVGLAVDGGNLMVARLQSQKASDSAVLAGMGYFSSLTSTEFNALGGTAAARNSAIQTRANRVANLNLKLANLNTVSTSASIFDPVASININGATENIPRLVNNITTNNRLLIMPAALSAYSLGNIKTTNTNAVTIRQRANIMVVADLSDSMSCPDGGDCSCLRLGGAACTGRTKLQNLQDALTAFSGYFLETYDRFGLVSFRTVANLDLGVEKTPGFNRANLNTAIANLTAAGNTNISDGLIRAYLDISAKNIPTAEGVSYIVFSDGAPTAARLLLVPEVGTSMADDVANRNVTTGLGNFDYTMYTIQRVQSATVSYPTPSLFIKTNQLPANFSVTTDIENCNTETDSNCTTSARPKCFATTAFPTSSDTSTYAATFQNCMNSLTAHLPNDTGSLISGAGSPSFADWRKVFFQATIGMADFLRSPARTNPGTVYVIGIGTDLTNPTDVKTSLRRKAIKDFNSSGTTKALAEYQNLDDNWFRKDIFLTRLANDYTFATQDDPVLGDTSTFGTLTNKKFPDFDDFSGIQTYEALRQQDRPGEGKFIGVSSNAGGTNALNNLNQAFRQIALRIKLRLIQ